MQSSISPLLCNAINTAVNELAVSTGDIHRSWRLHTVIDTEHQGAYRVEIIIGENILLRGLAFVEGSETRYYKVSLFLDTASLYGLLRGDLEKMLKQYTVEHPWLMGV